MCKGLEYLVRFIRPLLDIAGLRIIHWCCDHIGRRYVYVLAKLEQVAEADIHKSFRHWPK